MIKFKAGLLTLATAFRDKTNLESIRPPHPGKNGGSASAHIPLPTATAGMRRIAASSCAYILLALSRSLVVTRAGVEHTLTQTQEKAAFCPLPAAASFLPSFLPSPLLLRAKPNRCLTLQSEISAIIVIKSPLTTPGSVVVTERSSHNNNRGSHLEHRIKQRFFF